MMKIVTMLNQKGGVGKTSTTHHLAGTLAALGHSVLLVDNDPQSSLTQGLWGPSRAFGLEPGFTIHAIHAGDNPFPDGVIYPSGIQRMDLVPGSEACGPLNARSPQDLEESECEYLAEFLAEVSANYDLALIDCPPNLYYCSWAALVASHAIVVPMQPEDYGAQGIAAVRKSIALVQAGPNPGLRLAGYLLTMVGKEKIQEQYESQLRQVYGADVFAARVPKAVVLKEAISNRQPIVNYKPKSAAAQSIATLAAEFLARIDPASPLPAIPFPFPSTPEIELEEVA